MLRCTAAVVIELALFGCGGSGPEIRAGAPSAVSGAQAHPSALAQQLLGRWTMSPPPSERRTVALVRFALADPPDTAGFASMNPTPQEQVKFDDVLRLRRAEPDSPLLVTLHQRLDEVAGGTTVTFTDRDLISVTAAGTTINKYVIERELDREIVVREDGEGPIEDRRSIISFVGDDDIVLTHGSTRVPMQRVPAGSPRRPTEAPSRSAATNSGSSRFPALDACEQRYFACVAAMPAEARSAMGASLDAVRGAFARARSDSSSAASLASVCQSMVQTMTSAGYCPPS